MASSGFLESFLVMAGFFVVLAGSAPGLEPPVGRWMFCGLSGGGLPFVISISPLKPGL